MYLSAKHSSQFKWLLQGLLNGTVSFLAVSLNVIITDAIWNIEQIRAASYHLQNVFRAVPGPFFQTLTLLPLGDCEAITLPSQHAKYINLLLPVQDRMRQGHPLVPPLWGLESASPLWHSAWPTAALKWKFNKYYFLCIIVGRTLCPQKKLQCKIQVHTGQPVYIIN